MIYPLIYSLILSFHEWILGKGTGWIFNYGLNFVELVSDERMWNAYYVTAIFTSASVALEFTFGLILALIFMRKIRGRRILVSLLLLPMVTVPVLVGHMWRLMYFPDYGPIEQVTYVLTGVHIPWIAHDIASKAAIIIANVWEWTPFMFLLLLAGLSAIPLEAYEAAEIDGASRLQIFRYVTLPLAKPVMILALVIRTMEEIKIFDVVYLITAGGPGFSTETISMYIFLQGFQFFNIGYTCAISYLLLIIVTIIVTVFIRQIRRR